jgi:valyl-tRNA synthetase
MSKSLGNSPDLLELIEKFGADAVRFGILISAPAGNDLLFDESSCDQGRNFNNKLWNALKLVKMWEGRQTMISNQQSESFAVQWFENRLNEAKAQVEELYKQFRLSEALKIIYSLIWDDFCSWYLEWIKPPFEGTIDAADYNKTIFFFEELIQLLHPFMPFVTEEIYHQLKNRSDGDDICIKQFTSIQPGAESYLKQGILLKELITSLRDVRIKNGIKPKETIKLYIETDKPEHFESVTSILQKQVNAEQIHFVSMPQENSLSIVIDKFKLYIQTQKSVDTAGQKDQLLQELTYLKGFLVLVEKKLSNERFVSNAKPEVVQLERNKKSDAEGKIKAIEESLASL